MREAWNDDSENDPGRRKTSYITRDAQPFTILARTMRIMYPLLRAG